MYITKGYLDTLIMWLSLVPFATNGTYGHGNMDEKNNNV
jgi:hypothetical protein